MSTITTLKYELRSTDHSTWKVALVGRDDDGNVITREDKPFECKTSGEAYYRAEQRNRHDLATWVGTVEFEVARHGAGVAYFISRYGAVALTREWVVEFLAAGPYLDLDGDTEYGEYDDMVRRSSYAIGDLGELLGGVDDCRFYTTTETRYTR